MTATRQNHERLYFGVVNDNQTQDVYTSAIDTIVANTAFTSSAAMAVAPPENTCPPCDSSKYRVTVIGTNPLDPDATVEFKVDPLLRNFLLDTAEDSGIQNIPYSCRAGSCGTCAAKIVASSKDISESVDNSDQSFLDDDQINDGIILTCTAEVYADITIDIRPETLGPGLGNS